MVLILLAILLGSAAIVWLWKGPIKKTAIAMQEGGMSATEAYIVIVFLSIGLGIAIFMIGKVV